MHSALVVSVSAALKLVQASQCRGRLAVFLDEDYTMLLRLRETGGKNGWEFETCKNLFHDTYTRLEPELQRAFSILAKCNNGEVYWRSQLAARNAASNALPRLMTYLACAATMIKGQSRPLVFMVADAGLAFVLSTALLGRVDLRISAWYRLWRLRQFLVHGLRIVRFVSSALRNVWSLPRADLTALSNSSAPICLLRSWISVVTDTAPRSAQATYIDRSFGDLHHALRAAGFRPIYTPLQMNTRHRLADVRRQLASTDAEFIFPEQVVGAVDIFRVAWLGIRELQLRFDQTRVSDWEVGRLFEYVHLKDVLADDLMTFNLGAELPRRMRTAGVRIARVLYTFENNPHEKSYLLEARKHQPRAELIGFQHSPWYKEHPSMKLSPLEPDHPLPDRIIASGKIYRDALSASGFPVDRIELGTNLRFVISPPRDGDAAHGRVAFDILLILNYSMAQAAELLSYLAAALRIRRRMDMKVGIKPHPLLDSRALQDLISQVRLKNWTLVGGTVMDACQQSAMALAAGSSVANLEVLLSGRPLLQHSLENEFDRDCIWHDEDRIFRTMWDPLESTCRHASLSIL